MSGIDSDDFLASGSLEDGNGLTDKNFIFNIRFRKNIREAVIRLVELREKKKLLSIF